MKNNAQKNKGSITIEASLAITFFMFFILTFLSFSKYWTAQNRIKHALNQTVVTMSMDNEARTSIKSLKINLSSSAVGLLGNINEDAAGNAAYNTKAPYTDMQARHLRRVVMRDLTYYISGIDPESKDSGVYTGDIEKDCNTILSRYGISEIEVNFTNDDKIPDIRKSKLLGDSDKTTTDNFTVIVKYKIETGLAFFSQMRELEFWDFATTSLQ